MDLGDEGVFERDVVQELVKEVVDEIVGTTPYNQKKVGQWISNICEQTTKKLVGLGKPFKFVVTCVIMQRNGAGLHTTSSCFWDNANDGSASYRFEEKTLYCVTTVFALAI
ncbi:dynein light chain Tctex-type 1-like protein [Baffinella frigidus]|nr:dynein light chain Tctex-type 1-like protein [Cryptophyta sp. CCMP2293]|mmetsp:Transcript_49973/g.118913  ORF Transcript_49973/g.118913 Transcript_49973/m.118913 type:complete len:111 (+) Transcript_49973:198-530(+)